MPHLFLQPQPSVQHTPRLIEAIFVQFEEGFALPFERLSELTPALGFQRLAEFAERPLGLERFFLALRPENRAELIQGS
jgi:hypothetical protein